MGIQGLRKFISALSCTRTIYPRERTNNGGGKRSSSAPAAINGAGGSSGGKSSQNTAVSNARAADMKSKVEEQVANIFRKQDSNSNNNSATAAKTNTSSHQTTQHAASATSSSEGKNTGRLPVAHHVLFDLNSVIHSCFNKLEGNMSTAANTIAAVKERMEEILTTIVSPSRTLTICLDGPAPLAKIRTQRMRRRRVSTVNMAHSRQFSELSITAGSPFMVKLEREIALFLQEKYNDLFHTASQQQQQSPNNKKRVAIYLHGSTSAGEGESKISQMLAFHAYNPHTPYNPNDTVVILGNDIDLTLTAMGTMYYHNCYILSPSTLQAFCVGDIIYRWLCPGSGFLQDAHWLPSVRADLIFLFSLNGGDHFPGVGEAAADLWRRYKLLRSTNPSLRIVSDDMLSVDFAFLGDILQINEYEGQADPTVGLTLLKAALWSTFTTITGTCPDYRFTVPDTMLPSVSNLKAAVAANKNNRHACSIRYNPNASPLTPLATYTAVMPTIEMFPDGVRNAYHSLPANTKVNVRTLVASHEAGGGRHHQHQNQIEAFDGNNAATTYRLVPVNLTLEAIKKQLSNVNDTHMIVSGVEGLIKMAEENGFLSAAESARNTFTNPVFLTAPSSERVKRIAELTKDISRGRHLPENIKQKKEAELKQLLAEGPSFEIKPIVVRQPQPANANINGTTPNNNNNISDASNAMAAGVSEQKGLAPLSIADSYYSTVSELLFTNIFSYSVNATFDDFESHAVMLKSMQKKLLEQQEGGDGDADDDNIPMSLEEAMVAEEMNSFDRLLKKHSSKKDSVINGGGGEVDGEKKATATTSATAPGVLTASIVSNTVRRIPVVQAVPAHLQAIREKAVKIQNKDQQQREFTNMLKGKRDREVPDDDERGGRGGAKKGGARGEGNNGGDAQQQKKAAPQKKKGMMEDDDDYDSDAMADLDIDDDDEDEGVSRGKKKNTKSKSSASKKKGNGRSLADLDDDDEDDGYYTKAFADDDDDLADGGDDFDDGFGGGKKKKTAGGGVKKKVSKRK